MNSLFYLIISKHLYINASVHTHVHTHIHTHTHTHTCPGERHATWYSWGIGALTGSVYTFGFVLMCPQVLTQSGRPTVWPTDCLADRLSSRLTDS